MVLEIVNPLLWYVCKFCRRAYQLRDDLIQHKRSNHLELLLEDLAAKRRAREGVISAEPSTDVASPTKKLKVKGTPKSPVASENESVGSEESSTASDNAEINASATNLVTSSPAELSKSDEDSNQSTNEPTEPENKTQDVSRYWTSTPITSGPPKSPENSQDDTNSLDEFVTSSRTGRKLLKCDHCDRTFKQEHYRKLHITFKHDKNKRYPCQFCSEVFTHPRSRVFHVTKEHVDRMCRLTLAKSPQENSGGSASRTPKRGKKKPPGRVFDLKKRSRPNPYNNDDHFSDGSNQSDGSRSNLYECEECDETFGSMSELCLHKSYHKRKSNVH